jgi:alpha-glucan phosphorylase-like protein
MIGQLSDSQIKLKRIFIENQLPESLQPLSRLAYNLWWSWNKDASDLFKSIDPDKFIELNYNPVALLDTLSMETVQRLSKDQDFLKRLRQLEQDFDAYLAAQPAAGQPKIAYFSMEYGLHISLRLYSGGLGVLAGDYLKEASDSNVDLFAVGLLYRYGYFNQAIALDGSQEHLFPTQEFSKLPIRPVRDEEGVWRKITIGIQGRMVLAKIWELKVGRISLYLLDTDIDENSWEDRALTHRLYGGDNEHRLKQEILLGIGGVKAIREMGLEPELYHCNEGHAAFLNLERLKNFVEEQEMHYDEAVEAVRCSSLYTTHTPVPAGHDHFPDHLMQNYLYQYAADLGISWEDFLALGKLRSDDPNEAFSMSNLAIRLSQQVNGVSKLHGLVSQKMFTELFPDYTAEELHIGYVTNSVHYPTWIAPNLHRLYQKAFGKDFLADQSNPDHWRKIHDIPDKELFTARKELKALLLTYVRQKLQADMRRRGESPRAIYEVLNGIRSDALILGFARRFATYKRAHLLFTNRDRLREIVNNSDRPVLFLFAGKAHPADNGGQDLIRQIINISKEPDFAGKIIFLEDYNMEMAKLLVRGVDIWLNTPTRPLEASGTSGMKAALNGTVNFSVLDGWWAEGYRPDAGWALPLERTYEDQRLQNELDAEQIYTILEDEIIPIYFDHNKDGISPSWMNYVKQIIAEVAPHFTMKRMLDDYYDRFYEPLYESYQQFSPNHYAKAKELAAWKEDMRERWPGLEQVDLEAFDSDNHPLPVGATFKAKLTLKLNGIAPEHVGAELVFFKRLNDDELHLKRAEPLQVTSSGNDQVTFEIEVDPHLAGVYEYGYRIFPQHPLMPHRQDLNLAYWV